MLYCRTSSENMISYWWMKEIYSKLPYHYKKNLKHFYTVHPSMWTRLTAWWFTTFMAPAIKQKLHNIYQVRIITSGVETRIIIKWLHSGERAWQCDLLHWVWHSDVHPGAWHVNKWSQILPAIERDGTTRHFYK